jgi:hypothetical protein
VSGDFRGRTPPVGIRPELRPDPRPDAEPLVGEVVGLRTFRVDAGGLLLPLYSHEAWYDGVNVASCTPPTGDRDRFPHAVPDEDCECGFYAYGTAAAVRRHRQSHYVQAVVSCWGQVVAGTQGVRSQYARVDAIWLAPQAPDWLRRRVALRYPSARLYAGVDAMLAEHPLSALDCYEPARRQPVAVRVAGALAATAVVALGALPLSVLRHVPVLFGTWVAAAIAAGAVTAWLAVGTRSVGHGAAAVVVGGVCAWLVAPLFGWPGWLLRVPLLRGLLGGLAALALRLRPHHFPVERLPRARTFCGVDC